MKGQQLFYRKNIFLVVFFSLLISISLIVALYLAYNLTQKYVENEFASQKIDVLEETIKPYNDFFQNKVPEISFYQGFLDSASSSKYVDTIFRKYQFVERVVFYDVQVSNHFIRSESRLRNLSIELKAAFQFKRNISSDSVLLYRNKHSANSWLKTADEFNKMAAKFLGYIESSDTTRSISSDNIFNFFYSITPRRITYMNIPGMEEHRIFKELMFKDLPKSPVYDEDILTYYLNPFQLKIINSHPGLYQKISIRPLVYESLETDPDLISTDIPLSGAFSDYKLYLSSSKQFLKQETRQRFLPIAGTLMIIYAVLTLIAYLIYRNLNTNSRLFKLQYDFINNLTHEFKTPVSVIKIAGNNIRSANKLSEQERLHYGKILEEEADKLNGLMNKLLSFTQIENRSIQIKEENIDLEIFISNIIDAYQLKYPDFNIRHEITGIEYFRADPVLLGSIFDNLIDNAYKYSKTDNKELKIRIKKKKKNIVFRFTDTGIGIPKDETENIFKKFYRIQNQYNQHGSVGLGLAFCKELINFMDGIITVKSKVGKGSEFIIVLPYEN
ncbi:MAG TPA: sensor histidine kinase [Sphingobacteriaceae bacterium]|nr:sensor histidine kinase [Sphingobacteriaceae bacterium]